MAEAQEGWVQSECLLWKTSDLFPYGELAAKYAREGKGHANEGWFVDKHSVPKFCTEFNDVLFETVVKSSRSTTRMGGAVPKFRPAPDN